MTTEETSSKRIRCTSSESSQAAETVVSNVDLLTEILLRVPAKTLIRFRCVSKHWFYLISNPQFARNHSRQNPTLISGLYLYNYREPVASVSLVEYTNLPTLDFLDGVRAGSTTVIVDSCNGLMLCSNRDRTYFAVCNMTIQKYKLLPYLGCRLGFYCVYLAFDPSKSPHYKVVLARHAYDGGKPCNLIDIYSSESECWKRIRVTSPPNTPSTRGAFWNGAIHWMNEKLNIHIRFEVDAETLTITPMPPRPRILHEDKIRYFGECGGRLLLIQGYSDKGFAILEMDGNYCGWIVKGWVNLKPILKSLFPDDYHHQFSVLCVVNDAKGEDFAVVLHVPNKVISFNLKGKTWKVLHNFSEGEYLRPNERYYGSRYHGSGYQFIESLSPV